MITNHTAIFFVLKFSNCPKKRKPLPRGQGLLTQTNKHKNYLDIAEIKTKSKTITYKN